MNQNDMMPTTESYYLARTWKRIIARIFDVIFVSIIPFIVGLIMYYSGNEQQEWWKLLIIIIVNIITIGVYFVIIPWKMAGQTLGKWLFNIKLVLINNERLLLKHLLARELYLVFIPLLLTTITVIITLTFNSNIAIIKDNNWLNIIFRTIVSFDFAWYCGIMIVTKLDKHHQLFYDRKNSIYVINKKRITSRKPQDSNLLDEPHIHLVNSKPGIISDQELENIDSL